MKKIIFTMAVLVMAFGNGSFAQHKANLKSTATETVLKYYGVRDETMVVPQVATWQTIENEQYRTTYTYDEYDYYLIEEYTQIDDDGWMDYYMVTYEYDFSGNVLEALVMSAYETGVMENNFRASYSYNSGMLSEVIYQYWEEGEWVNETKEVYNYNGDVTTVLFWDWNGNNWTSDELYTYTNNGNSTIELLIQYMQGGAWQNDEKQIFTLDFDEHVIEILDQNWVNNTWVNDELTTYSYEGGDVFLAKDIDVWTGEYWRNEYHFIYVYDSDGNAKQGWCYYVGDGFMTYANNDIEMAYGYSAKSNEYYGWNVNVEYVDLTGINEDAKAISFLVYPVPAQDVVHIETESFQKAEVYSLTGQKLIESLQNNMNVSQLSSGLYIIKVYDLEGNCHIQRFVVR